MVTLVCTFSFPDGGHASATAASPSPERAVPVRYGGDFARLPDRWAEADLTGLEVWAVQIARETGASLGVQWNGTYDFWAE